MKKVFSLLAVLALVCMASSVWAATTNTSYGVKIASVTFRTEAISFEATLYDWVSGKDFTTYSGTGVGVIGFNVPNTFVLGTTEEQIVPAKTIAKITHNLTQQPVGTTIYIYTDNKNATGDFKANAPILDGSTEYYGGLVRKGNTSTYVTGDIADLYMIIRTPTEANTDERNYKTTLPTFTEQYPTIGYKKMIDISDTNFSSYTTAQRVIGVSGTNGGIWHYANDSWVNDKFTGSDAAIIFFGAGFRNVLSGDIFGSSTITFATVTE